MADFDFGKTILGTMMTIRAQQQAAQQASAEAEFRRQMMREELNARMEQARLAAETQRYGVDVGADAQRYGVDRQAEVALARLTRVDEPRTQAEIRRLHTQSQIETALFPYRADLMAGQAMSARAGARLAGSQSRMVDAQRDQVRFETDEARRMSAAMDSVPGLRAGTLMTPAAQYDYIASQNPQAFQGAAAQRDLANRAQNLQELLGESSVKVNNARIGEIAFNQQLASSQDIRTTEAHERQMQAADLDLLFRERTLDDRVMQTSIETDKQREAWRQMGAQTRQELVNAWLAESTADDQRKMVIEKAKQMGLSTEQAQLAVNIMGEQYAQSVMETERYRELTRRWSTLMDLDMNMKALGYSQAKIQTIMQAAQLDPRLGQYQGNITEAPQDLRRQLLRDAVIAQSGGATNGEAAAEAAEFMDLTLQRGSRIQGFETEQLSNLREDEALGELFEPVGGLTPQGDMGDRAEAAVARVMNTVTAQAGGPALVGPAHLQGLAKSPLGRQIRDEARQMWNYADSWFTPNNAETIRIKNAAVRLMNMADPSREDELWEELGPYQEEIVARNRAAQSGQFIDR